MYYWRKFTNETIHATYLLRLQFYYITQLAILQAQFLI